MGEPSSSLKKYNQPLEQVTSSSLEAIQLLAQGFRKHLTVQYDRPSQAVLLSYYKRAVDLDPSFALAWASLGTVDSPMGNAAAAIQDEAKAYQLRDRLIPQLRYLVVTLYFSIGGDLEKAYPIYEEWVQAFPLDYVAHYNFATALQALAQFDRAASEYREAIRLSPTSADYVGLMYATMSANRLAEAKAIYEEAKSHKLDSTDLHNNAQLLAFLQHDDAGMREQVAWAKDNPVAEQELMAGMAMAKAFHGQFREAHSILQKIAGDVERARITYLDSVVFPLTFGLANDENECGNPGAAHDLLAKLKREHPEFLQDSPNYGLLEARAGDIEQARKIAESTNQRFPVDTIVQNYYLPTIYAAIRLRQNDPAGAVASLQPALRYELFNSHNTFNSLYPAYFRGLAFLQLGNGHMAATEFQKLIDHSAIVGRETTGALAYLQLGRGQVMTGDKAAARNSYKTFLDLWKDADSDIPALKQAKAEYAKLQ